MKAVIEFDGGTPCNIPSRGYGIGYGSYRVNAGTVVRVNHGIPMSCNAAEIFTLIEAIESLPDAAANTDLMIIGDSKLILSVANNWNNKSKVNKKTSEAFRTGIATLKELLRQFRSVNTRWQPRLHSVATFGH